MKRGQTEVVGLLVIVVLLLFLGVIFLTFYLNNPASLRKDIRADIEANSILNAVVKLEFDDLGVEEHLDGCYNYGECDLIKLRLEEVLEAVLEPSREYKLVFTVEEREVFNIGECDVGVMANYPVIRENNYYNLGLRLC